MQLWLNGRKPAYMDSVEKNSLTHDNVAQAVNSMTYQGLQVCAAGYLMAMQRCGWSPKEIAEAVEGLEEVQDARAG